jgi:hypothetical protein
LYLRQLEEAGLPLFTYGYEKAVVRLRLYASEQRAAAKPRRLSSREDTPLIEDGRRRLAQELTRWDRSACDRTLAG